MGKALHETSVHAEGRLDWRKRMSDNVALALIVYTGLQIFVTVHALKQGFPSMFAYFALVMLVGAIIPACRWFEKRWMDIGDADAADPALAGAFRRDQALPWLLAGGLPFLVTGVLKLFIAA